MSLRHFHIKDANGIWHTCYRIPGTDNAQSLLESLAPGPAKREAERLNREQAAAARSAAFENIPPHQRPVRGGIYTNEDPR